MKKSLLLALAATAATLAAAPPAQARDRCGAGYHRNAHGRCVMNHRARRPVLVIGRYYNGHGWWDGRRYYRHRYMHRGHWRYR
jgi:hypothetical protein